MANKDSNEGRVRRKMRIRKKVEGLSDRPRLSVYRSANHIYAQIIDDLKGHTLAAASTLSPEFKDWQGHTGNIEAAKEVGKLIASHALAANINQVVFDRNGFLYHGRIKALADAAREAGLVF